MLRARALRFRVGSQPLGSHGQSRQDRCGKREVAGAESLLRPRASLCMCRIP